MIIRIALYPLLSCFLSITVCILDVYSITQRNLTDVVRRFNWVRCQPQNLCIGCSSTRIRCIDLLPPPPCLCATCCNRSLIHPCHALPAPESISAMCES
ncbi:hypothetical protein B0H13DRAFT_2077494 [Mycena leptocephala]|nr:hypothetical protein B0H13DRAFT_2077494 [Mycena leptocephala]